MYYLALEIWSGIDEGPAAPDGGSVALLAAPDGGLAAPLAAPDEGRFDVSMDKFLTMLSNCGLLIGVMLYTSNNTTCKKQKQKMVVDESMV